ncbi:MAG TPA: cold shock domain-containing protein [Thermoanaerobaculia bacterium]|jgi:cold shock CspA family protein
MSTTRSSLDSEHLKPQDERRAIVTRVYRDGGYGFLKTPEGREIFFHRNAVLDDFAGLDEGTEVRFVESTGQLGPKATTVEIVDPPVVLEGYEEPSE